MALIYIVEDDINIREIERYALKNSGFEVEEFDNGKDFFCHFLFCRKYAIFFVDYSDKFGKESENH